MSRARRALAGVGAVAWLAGTAGAELSVAQRDALLRSQRVGRALVDALAARERVAVIVALREMAGGASLASAAPDGFALGRRYRHVRAVAGSVDAAGLAALVARPEVARVDVDQRVTVRLAQSVPLVGLDALADVGLTGAGSRVAVIDTGVYAAHVDLASSLVAEHCFCTTGEGEGCCLNGETEDDGPGSAADQIGHGTWVSGVVTSDGIVVGPGAAPGAELVVVKTFATGDALTSDIVAALDWIASSQPEVDVVNMSLGTLTLYTGVCDAADASTMAFADAVDALVAAGVLVAASSGNDGSATAMGAPACVSGALSVGAVWDGNNGSQTAYGCTDTTTAADQVPCWSNGNALTDLLAPGARIRTTQGGGGSVQVRGTSFASPHVAGCAAVLRQAQPQLTPAQLAAALRSSPVSVLDPKNGLVYPRLDCGAAFAAALPDVPAPSGPLLLPLAGLLVAAAILLRRRRGA